MRSLFSHNLRDQVKNENVKLEKDDFFRKIEKMEKIKELPPQITIKKFYRKIKKQKLDDSIKSQIYERKTPGRMFNFENINKYRPD